MVGDQTQPAYVMPYSVFWRKGSGLCAWNTDSTQYVFGSYSTESTSGPHYYYSPVGNCPIGFSSAEMDSSQTMTASEIDHQSVDVTFAPGTGSGTMTIPLIQGNAFLTSLYSGLTPQLFGGAFTSITGVTFKAGNAASVGSKYRVTINNGDTWLLYVFPKTAGSSATMTLTSSTLITGPAGFSGVLQIAKLPLNYATSDETVYDSAAGTYGTQNVISGSSTGAVGTYTFNFGAVSLGGNQLLSYLFPHQVSSVSSGTATSLKLWSNTKGQMQAYLGNTLSFTESDMPIDVQFLPWSPLGNLQNYSVSALQAIAAAANSEAAQVMSSQTDLDSMYYSGKALAKFAQICLTIHDVLEKDATSCVSELEQSMALFISNSNINPIVYDTVWKGAISSCGNSGCDFGNAWYNDHHFHYGYFVYTAAVIAHLDASWLTTGNKAYINTLLRDFANPSTSDTAFPQFRSFDWYAGHSWAHGINAAGDGKDEESSSEDYNAIYGMKLWGKVTGDASMEGRGNLMLAVMRRSMQNNMLMATDNSVQPAAFRKQYAAGITFMNKVDHTTYFGQNEQYIQGIHMIPLTPISAYIRTPTFVAEEWNAVITPIVGQVTDGWLGILMANYAIANSTAAYNFFSSSSFSSSYLDGGASLTWYLTYAAGLGGAGDFQLAVDSSNGKASTAVVVQPTTSASSKVIMSTSTAKSSESTSIGQSSTLASAAKTSATSSSTSMSFSSSSSTIKAGISAVSGSAINVGYISGTQVPTSSSTLVAASTDLTSSLSAVPSSFEAGSASALAETQAGQTSSALAVASLTDLSATASVTAPATTVAAQAPVSTDASAYNIVTLALANGLRIACQNAALVVAEYADPITVFDNGTLSCGDLGAFLAPKLVIAERALSYSINLASVPATGAVKSNFTLNGTNLLAYAYPAGLSKRQAVTVQPLQFAYGSDNVVVAIVSGQATNMTTFEPQVVSEAVFSPSSSSGIMSATSVSDVASSVSSSAAEPTSTVSTTIVQTLTSSTTLHLPSTGVSNGTLSTAAPNSPNLTSPSTGQSSPSATTNSGPGSSGQNSAGSTQSDSTSAVSNGSGASSESGGSSSDNSDTTGSASESDSAGGDATSAQQGSQAQAVAAGQYTANSMLTVTKATTAPVYTESTTTTIKTTLHGQETAVVSVLPVTTVMLTSTYTSTICGQCTAASLSNNSAAVQTGQSATSTDEDSSPNAAAADTSAAAATAGAQGTASATTSGQSDSTASGSDTQTGGSNAQTSDSNAQTGGSDTQTGSSNAAAAAVVASSSSSNSMPIVSATSLPISTGASTRLITSLSGCLLAMLAIYLV